MQNKTNVTKPLNRLLATKAEVFKPGVDVHARDVVVCLQLDGSVPQQVGFYPRRVGRKALPPARLDR